MKKKIIKEYIKSHFNKKRFLQGIQLSLLLIFVTFSSIAPARIAVSIHEAQFGRKVWELILAGLGKDINQYLHLVSAVSLIFLCFADGINYFLKNIKKQKQVIIFITFGSLLFISLYAFSVLTTEFKIQRGIYPTFFDLYTSGGNTAFFKSSIPIFSLKRYFNSFLISIVLTITAFIYYLKKSESPLFDFSFGKYFGFIFTVIIFAVGGFQIFLASPKMLSSIHARRDITSVFDRFVFSVGMDANHADGIKSLITMHNFNDDEKKRGGNLLGFSDEQVSQLIEQENGDKTNCENHPLSSHLPGVKYAQNTSFPVNLNKLDKIPKKLVETLLLLSKEIFQNSNEPIYIWQILLESIRGVDINSLNPHAPKYISPFINSLYNEESYKSYRIIKSYKTFQAGVRTTQGISAIVCGLGSIPYNLSFSRDLGLPPMRCLSDILKDGKIEPSIYYGSGLSFDNMQQFFQYHGFNTIGDSLLSKGLPRGGWGVSDRALFDEVINIVQNKEKKSQYSLIMSLSNHSPFNEPDDMPAKLKKNILSFLEKKYSNVVNTDSVKFILTQAYTDFALKEFIDKVNKNKKFSNSIFIISADHIFSEKLSIWKKEGIPSKDSQLEFKSKIPFVILISNHFYQNKISKVSKIINKINLILKDLSISQNDIPYMLLTLLSETQHLKGLEKKWQWHTLGTQVLSPYFKFNNSRDFSMWGINGESQIYLFDKINNLMVAKNKAVPISAREDILKNNPSIIPVTAFLSSLFKGYEKKCWHMKNIRKVN